MKKLFNTDLTAEELQLKITVEKLVNQVNLLSQVITADSKTLKEVIKLTDETQYFVKLILRD